MIRLFLENKEVELGENFSCPITKTFEDIQNPTSIINDYSKTITIPHTKNNDRLFGFLFNPDRLTAREGTTLTGIYFDPYQKIAFRLEYNDYVLMTGYLKVLTVTSKGYECSLNGELGKIFQELQKITFDETKYEGDEKTKYYIDGSQWFNSKIDRQLIYDAWNLTANNSALKKTTEAGYHTYDVIGWTPNNSFNEGFDYKTFQTKENTSKLFSEVLEEKAQARGFSYADITGVSGETAVGDGLSPRSIGEFRSYLQLPFVYWNQLWRIFQTKGEAVTGYKFDLDDKWFNDNNPYWNKLCYNLKNFDVKATTTDPSTADFATHNYGTFTLNTETDRYTPSIIDMPAYDFVPTIISKKKSDLYKINDPLINVDNYVLYDGNLNVTINCGENDVLFKNSISIIFNVTDENGTTLTPRIYSILIVGDITHTQTGFDQVVEWKTIVGHNPTKNVSFKFTINPIYNKKVKIQVRPAFWGNIGKDCFDPTVNSFSFSIEQKNVNYSYILRPNSTIQTFNSFWNNEYNLFTEILNYCKIFRINIIADDANKKLKFVQAKDYFRSYTLKDWTKKLDKSKDYTITPVTWDKKYVLFNYKDKDTDIAAKYKEDFGVNYGEHRIITRYNFNDDTSDLFTDIRNTIVYTPNVNSWTDLYDDMKIVYKLPAEIYLDINKDNKTSNTFGCFFFVNKKPFDKTSNMRNVKISDDSLLQVSTQTYFYSQYSDNISTDYYLEPCLFYGDQLCLFDTPQENYTYDNDYLNNKQGIYDILWKNYIDERYNTQNKIVDCYLKLTPQDISSFEFNHFVIIENQLYVINKISDYDISNTTGSTKVQLITIQNIEGYCN